jgi:hypothetical protein
MEPNIHPFYKHSGKFNPLIPLLALLAAVIAGIPLGLLYGSLMKWIPFIYLNVLITFGYGMAFGVLTVLLMKAGKVRNNFVAFLGGAGVGMIAWYFAWNGCIHSLADKAPWILSPMQIRDAADYLYTNGSWSIGFSGHEPITGIPLAIVWLIEGAMIVTFSAMVGYNVYKNHPLL